MILHLIATRQHQAMAKKNVTLTAWIFQNRRWFHLLIVGRDIIFHRMAP